MALYIFTHCVVHGVPINEHFNDNDVECPEVTNGSITFIPSPTNCSEYYVCVNRIAYLFSCPITVQGILYFDPTINVCNWPWLVDCHITTLSPSTKHSTTTIGTTTKTPAETTPHAITTVGTTKTPDETTSHAITLTSTTPSDTTTFQPENSTESTTITIPTSIETTASTTTLKTTSTKDPTTTAESTPFKSSTTPEAAISTSEKVLTTKVASTPTGNQTTIIVQTTT